MLASRAAYQQAVKAYEAHDVPAFLAHARDAQRLRPDHGGVTYALASACAMSGDTAGAFAMLRRFARAGLHGRRHGRLGSRPPPLAARVRGYPPRAGPRTPSR